MQEKTIKNKELGDEGEDIACDFLRDEGFEIIGRNFGWAGGEVDIIATRRGAIHFIEVRTRTHGGLARPLETIDERKRKRIRRAAELWLAKSRNNFNYDNIPPCLFSVIGIDMVGDRPDVEFIEDAFD